MLKLDNEFIRNQRELYEKTPGRESNLTRVQGNTIFTFGGGVYAEFTTPEDAQYAFSVLTSHQEALDALEELEDAYQKGQRMLDSELQDSLRLLSGIWNVLQKLKHLAIDYPMFRPLQDELEHVYVDKEYVGTC